ncbi:hypothetical protein ACLOJK_006578 [Asimina triloba]
MQAWEQKSSLRNHLSGMILRRKGAKSKKPTEGDKKRKGELKGRKHTFTHCNSMITANRNMLPHRRITAPSFVIIRYDCFNSSYLYKSDQLSRPS